MKALRAFFAGRRALLGFWLLLCAISAASILRLTVFMLDPTRVSYSMVPDSAFLTAHSCFSAYVAAADCLDVQGTNIYDSKNYPRRGDDTKRRIPIGAFEQDRYEYPPPFLLLPKAFLLVSRDFRVVRALWFVMNIAVILGSMGMLAAWIGGRRGLATALLSPLCWASFPHLLTLQTGNVQFVIFTMSIAAMVAFDRGRPAVGGALLAFAIGAKIYPGVLLLVLLVQRRFRDALFTIGFGLIFSVLLVAIAGFSPFSDFFSYQLPRLFSGEAFAFFKETLENKATNNSIFGVPYRLQMLGLVQDPDRIAPVLNRLYTVAVAAVTTLMAWKGPKMVGRSEPPPEDTSRVARCLMWLALLNLSTLQSPFAPPYVLLGTLWVLTVWAPWGPGFWRTAALFAAGWLSIAVAIPKPLSLLLASGLIGQAAHLGINLAMLRWALRPRSGDPPELTA